MNQAFAMGNAHGRRLQRDQQMYDMQNKWMLGDTSIDEDLLLSNLTPDEVAQGLSMTMPEYNSAMQQLTPKGRQQVDNAISQYVNGALRQYNRPDALYFAPEGLKAYLGNPNVEILAQNLIQRAYDYSKAQKNRQFGRN